MKNIKIAKLIAILRRQYKKSRAPVTELIRWRGKAPLQTLVATILSSRTLDQTTTAACKRLFRVARATRDFKRLPLRQIEKLIYPVGFYRVKARQLKALPAALDKLFGGRIPATAVELMRLPGVGRKTANLVAAQAFNRKEICVDVHVQRIANRLGLVRARTPLATEMALRRVVPQGYWGELNHLLVAFGQTICRPRHPECDECPLRQYCLYSPSPVRWQGDHGVVPTLREVGTKPGWPARASARAMA